jgi:hypothetical protein
MKLNPCKLHSEILIQKPEFLAAIFFAFSSAIYLISECIPQIHANALKPLVKIAKDLVQDHDIQIEKQI